LTRIQAILQFAEPIEQPGIESLYLPIEDLEPIAPEFLKQGVAFARKHKRQDHRVLIACGAGINRSTAFTVAVLKEEEGLSLVEAWRVVKRQHPDASPLPPIWESLCRYYQEEVPYAKLISTKEL